MNYKKLAAVLPLLLCLCVCSCKKKEDISLYDSILRKWCRSQKELNYTRYRECEAYPKAYPVFREMYRDYYFEDIMIVNIDEIDKKNVMKDPEGNEFISRNTDFECSEFSRKAGRPTQVVRGNLRFIRFKTGPRKDDGWLMSNRTMVRIKR